MNQNTTDIVVRYLFIQLLVKQVIYFIQFLFLLLVNFLFATFSSTMNNYSEKKNRENTPSLKQIIPSKMQGTCNYAVTSFGTLERRKDIAFNPRLWMILDKRTSISNTSKPIKFHHSLHLGLGMELDVDTLSTTTSIYPIRICHFPKYHLSMMTLRLKLSMMSYLSKSRRSMTQQNLW